MASKKDIIVVHYPAHLGNDKTTGPLFGYFHKDSNHFNIISCGHSTEYTCCNIGDLFETEPINCFNEKLIGFRKDKEMVFKYKNTMCNSNPYDLLLNIFSRNSGILETNKMLSKSAIICGLGSVGSLVAAELARAGVGHFMLVDNDTLEYHNICRHQLGIRDVGRYKVNAVTDQLKNINPQVKISAFVSILEDLEETVFNNFITPETIIIGCGDNREADLYANSLSKHYNIPFISIGFWERAFAGEIFYSIPGKTPCYECLFGETDLLMSNRHSVNRRYYTEQEDLSETNFEPGISTDINFITIIGVKICIDLLNFSSKGYNPTIINHLTQFTLICNNNKAKHVGPQAEIFSHPLQITTSIKIDYSPTCKKCNKN